LYISKGLFKSIKYISKIIKGVKFLMDFPHEGHEKHLCKIWSDTYEVDKVRDLVKPPNFICKICGRVAKKEENLCYPIKL
jgi:hypothetical protein